MTKEDLENQLDKFIQRHNLWQMERSIVKDFIWRLLCDGRDTRVCEHCGSTFVVARKDQRFCLAACKKTFFNEQRKTK